MIPTAEIEEFNAPNSLTVEQRQVWCRLAPQAFKQRTLTRATAAAFELLCKTYALMERYEQSLVDAGGANHRGLIARVETGLTAFCIRPMGKPIYEAELAQQQPVNPLEKFLTRTRG